MRVNVGAARLNGRERARIIFGGHNYPRARRRAMRYTRLPVRCARLDARRIAMARHIGNRARGVIICG